MAAFLDTLAALALGQAPLLAVRVRARFEPAAEADVPVRSDPFQRVVADPVVPEPVTAAGAAPVVPGRVVPEPVTRLGATGGPVTEQVAEATSAAPVRSPAARAADQQVDRPAGDPIDQQDIHQPDIDRQDRAPTRAPVDVQPNPTPPPEPRAPHAVQPTSPPTVPPTARQARRLSSPATVVTRPPRPDAVRATPRRRPVNVPPPQQLLTEHVVPALVRAGLVSPDGAHDVRLDPTSQPDDVRETVGAARVPEMHVHIGRVEVTQASPAPAPKPAQAPAPGPPARARPRLPAVDHDAYLARRRQSNRGAR